MRLPLHTFARTLTIALVTVTWTGFAFAQTAVPNKGTSTAMAPANSWKLLSAQEKRALAPLAARWGELSENQKSKWLAISRNFDELPAADKAVMHARMSEWVALSPVQRNQARLNFNTLQNLPKDEKKAKWDEYQTLSQEQKRLLSSHAAGLAKTTAPSPRPANAERLVPASTRQIPSSVPARAPVDKKTLLPVPTAAAPAEVPGKSSPVQPESAASPRDGSPS